MPFTFSIALSSRRVISINSRTFSIFRTNSSRVPDSDSDVDGAAVADELLANLPEPEPEPNSISLANIRVASLAAGVGVVVVVAAASAAAVGVSVGVGVAALSSDDSELPGDGDVA